MWYSIQKKYDDLTHKLNTINLTKY